MEEKKKKKKIRIKKQVIFNLFSILFVFGTGFYFLGRLIYYKMESEKPYIAPTDLATRVIEENDTYELRKTFVETNGIYRFVGDVDNNYVKYKGYLWRIVRINADKTITLVTEDTVTSLPYGGSLQNYILSWLNLEEEKNTGIFENTLEAEDGELRSTKQCFDSFLDIESAGCFESNSDYKIGLLSIYDYLEANANESYLNNGTNYWTTNSHDDSRAWYVSSEGLVSYDDYTSKYGIRPTITIDGNTQIVSGIGTADDPFQLNTREINTLQNAYPGSYLLYNDTLWKVVSKENDKVKVVSEDCIKQGEECLLMRFSLYDNEFSLSREEMLYYLNNTYYNSLKDKEYIVDGNFYAGTYSLADNNYRSALESKVHFKIGLLSIADPFAFEVAKTFLFTTSKTNEMSIYSVNDNHVLYENMVTEELAIRPAFHLKGNIKIASGTGDYLNPYVLGGLE